MSRFVRGETGVIVPVPEAEPVVGEHRRAHDSSARYGVPPHVTLVYPFLPQTAVDKDVLDSLSELFAATPALDVTFGRCARFPGETQVLYLAPSPDIPFRELTAAIWTRWPEAPPYGGQFDDPIPHLTVTDQADATTVDAIAAGLSGRLPLSARATEAHLVAFDGHRWLAAATFPFGRPGTHPDR